jgi:VWFA-related protein
MIRRAALPVLWCAAALAQLPSPQSAPPKPEPEHNRKTSTAAPEVQLLHVDARVTDFEGRPATGLTAADFTVETDGKPQKVEQCRYVEARPVRVALVVDNLSLSRPHLAALKTALHQAIDALPPGHEFALMRTSGGEGALEQLTSDRALLASALDQIAYHSLQADPAAFQVGTLGALEAVLDGLNLVPGRKAVLLFSEGLRDPQRARGFPREVTLKSAARRASAVVYAYDALAPAEQAVASASYA